MFGCPRFETIRAEFLKDKSSWEDLDIADWRKGGDEVEAWYFEAAAEFFGHLYGAMTGRSATQVPGIRGELAKLGGNGNGGRTSLA